MRKGTDFNVLGVFSRVSPQTEKEEKRASVPETYLCFSFSIFSRYIRLEMMRSVRSSQPESDALESLGLLGEETWSRCGRKARAKFDIPRLGIIQSEPFCLFV